MRIVAYAIVSADGMLADRDRHMPDALKVEADQRFFESGLDATDVVVHGRHSYEGQTNSPRRRRLILTRRVDAVANDPSNPNARLWNPAGASFETACAALGILCTCRFHLARHGAATSCRAFFVQSPVRGAVDRRRARPAPRPWFKSGAPCSASLLTRVEGLVAQARTCSARADDRLA